MEGGEDPSKSEGGGLRADASHFLSPHPPSLESTFHSTHQPSRQQQQQPQAATAGPLSPQQSQHLSLQQAPSCNVDKAYSGEAARRGMMLLQPHRESQENQHNANTQEAIDCPRPAAESRLEYHSLHWGPPGPPPLHVGGGGWGGPPCYRVEGPGRHPSDLASRLSACRGGEAAEEEEKDDPESDTEEEEHRFFCVFSPPPYGTRKRLCL
ncbi:hypothetical protein Emed_007645 [Eimeria media]